MKQLKTPCIEWEGAKSGQGYGYKRHNGKVKQVHVIAYEEAHGPVPEGCEVDHICDNRACRNAEHLQAITHTANMRRARSTRLTLDDARTIRASEESTAVLAERYGIVHRHVQHIRSGRSWAEAA